jgi:DNA (cytosine-5)-methyltransferase 1
VVREHEVLNGLDLFSGIGGLAVALSPWVRPVAYCENDRYAQAVLLSRMAGGELPVAPIWDDVRTFRGSMLPPIDIVYGGFPCQDISIAGRGAGLAGERSGLFIHMARIAEEVCPAFIFLENVPAIRTRGLSVVMCELARLGFDLRWTTVSAAEVGAPHLRKRWFCLAAHPERFSVWLEPGRRSGENGQDQTVVGLDGASKSLADTTSIGWRKRESESAWIQRGSFTPIGGGEISHAVCAGLSHGRQTQLDPFADPRALSELERRGGSGWATEPNVGRVAHGIHARVDRLRGLGNAVVPLQARTAFARLCGFEVVKRTRRVK